MGFLFGLRLKRIEFKLYGEKHPFHAKNLILRKIHEKPPFHKETRKKQVFNAGQIKESLYQILNRYTKVSRRTTKLLQIEIIVT